MTQNIKKEDIVSYAIYLNPKGVIIARSAEDAF